MNEYVWSNLPWPLQPSKKLVIHISVNTPRQRAHHIGQGHVVSNPRAAAWRELLGADFDAFLKWLNSNNSKDPVVPCFSNAQVGFGGGLQRPRVLAYAELDKKRKSCGTRGNDCDAGLVVAVRFFAAEPSLLGLFCSAGTPRDEKRPVACGGPAQSHRPYAPRCLLKAKRLVEPRPDEEFGIATSTKLFALTFASLRGNRGTSKREIGADWFGFLTPFLESVGQEPFSTTRCFARHRLPTRFSPATKYCVVALVIAERD